MGILKRKNALSANWRGFTMIEVLAVVAILAILITMSIFTFMAQLAKGRDAKRKADLEKVRTILEDYMNDNFCYPPNLVCNQSFSPYISQVPCDPLNNTNYNYFYSFDAAQVCKSWYKIYAKLQNTNDPIIAKVGCADGCGPSGNYNYWVSSPNMNQVGQILPGENWWPEITLPTPTLPSAPTSTPPAGATPTPTPTPTSAPGPTSTPTPTSMLAPTPTPSPTSGPVGDRWGCFSGSCLLLTPPPPYCSPNYVDSNCFGRCLDLEGNPTNECKYN